MLPQVSQHKSRSRDGKAEGGVRSAGWCVCACACVCARVCVYACVSANAGWGGGKLYTELRQAWEARQAHAARPSQRKRRRNWHHTIHTPSAHAESARDTHACAHGLVPGVGGEEALFACHKPANTQRRQYCFSQCSMRPFSTPKPRPRPACLRREVKAAMPGSRWISPAGQGLAGNDQRGTGCALDRAVPGCVH